MQKIFDPRVHSGEGAFLVAKFSTLIRSFSSIFHAPTRFLLARNMQPALSNIWILLRCFWFLLKWLVKSHYFIILQSLFRFSKALSKCSNYPNSIREILAMSSKKYFQLINFLSNFSTIHEKIQTPWTIQFYVVKNTSMKIFLWSKKHKFLNLAMFSKNIEKFWDIAKISRILFG